MQHRFFLNPHSLCFTHIQGTVLNASLDCLLVQFCPYHPSINTKFKQHVLIYSEYIIHDEQMSRVSLTSLDNVMAFPVCVLFSFFSEGGFPQQEEFLTFNSLPTVKIWPI